MKREKIKGIIAVACAASIIATWTSGITAYAQDNSNVNTSTSTVSVEKNETAPKIMITEVCPNPKGSTDYYEFFELYNNSNETIDLKGYTILYLYPSGSTPKKYTITDSVKIEPYSTKVVWLTKYAIPAGNDKIDNFNNNFNTDLSEDDVYKFDNTSCNFNLPNSLKRGIAISKSTSVNDIICEAWFDSSSPNAPEGIIQSVENSSITYKWVEGNGTKMTVADRRTYSTPGTLEEGQVPEVDGVDNIAPEITSTQNKTFAEIGKEYKITAKVPEKLKEAYIMYGLGAVDTNNKIPMNIVSSENGVYTYEASITLNELGNYKYKIVGVDEANNKTILPHNESGYNLECVEADKGTSPVLKCLDDSITSIDEGKDLVIPYSHTDDNKIREISVYYKPEGQNEYSKITTTSFRVPGKYFTNIPGNKLLGSNYVDYYLEAKDDFHTVQTEVKRIKINRLHNDNGIRTNLTDNEVISGNTLITANDSKNNKNVNIKVDGNKVDTYSTMEKGAFFEVSYTGIDSYFKNAIAVGDNVLTYLAKWFNTLPSKSVFVDKKYFTKNDDGSVSVTISMLAGTQGSAFELYDDANNDDYKFTDFHLVLLDGTVLNPDNGYDPSIVYSIGDSTNMSPKHDLHFTIPKDKVDAAGFMLDTKTLKDGKHNISFDSLENNKTISVIVDNTAPEINVNLNEGDTLLKKFTVNAEVTDNTEVNESATEIWLDGSPLKKPYTFVPADMDEGEHTLTVKAVDKAGNSAEKTINFKTKSTYSKTKDQASENNNKSAKLKLSFEGEYNEGANVNFYKADVLKKDEIKIYNGTGDNPFSSAKEAALNDGIASKTGEFPYQMMELTVNNCNDNDKVSVSYTGKVNYNKEIKLFVYSVEKNQWELLDSTKGQDGKITGEFTAKGHVKDGKALVLAQGRTDGTLPKTETNARDCEKINDPSYVWDGTGIPSQYDFSFAWITDTQYYCESYNDVFTNMNKWIVSQKDAQNIKYVIHTGDLVDEWDQIDQWNVLDENLKIFEDANLPYGVLAGNHDVAAGNEIYDNYFKYCGEDRFKNQATYGESYKNNLGHYDLLTEDGQDFIVLYMGWDIYTNEINWMNEVLAKYKDRKAILCFHRYTNADGNLDYTGDLVQREVVAKNPNVFAVLDGHYHGAAINIKAFDDDNDGVKERNVYQICTDYQSADLGGSGYVKMLYFDLQNNKVYMNSYSPVLNDFNYYDNAKLDSYSDGVIKNNQDIYELSTNFNTAEKSLEGESVEAKVYKSDLIGTATVKNNEASVNYEGLESGKDYYWYGEVTNNNDLVTRTDINKLTYNNKDEKLKLDSFTAGSDKFNISNNVKLTANASGSSKKISYRFVAMKDGKIVYVRNFNEKNTAVWTPSEEGDYKLYVVAKDTAGNEVKKTISYKVNNNLSINSFGTTSKKAIKANKGIKLFVNGTGDNLKYKFTVMKDGKVVFSRSYKEKNTVVWTPSEAGDYIVCYKVKDASGNEKSQYGKISVGK